MRGVVMQNFFSNRMDGRRIQKNQRGGDDETMENERKEKRDLLEQGPKIWEAYNSLECQHRLPKASTRT